MLFDREAPIQGIEVVFTLVGGSFAACGLIAWRRRPDSRSGMLMTATGFLFFVSLSTGADVLIEVAGERDDLAALVSDGAAAGSFEDMQRLQGTSLYSPVGFVMFSTIQVLTGDAPGPPLEEAIERIWTPTLLVSAGTTLERDFNVDEELAR